MYSIDYNKIYIQLPNTWSRSVCHSKNSNWKLLFSLANGGAPMMSISPNWAFRQGFSCGTRHPSIYTIVILANSWIGSFSPAFRNAPNTPRNAPESSWNNHFWGRVCWRLLKKNGELSSITVVCFNYKILVAGSTLKIYMYLSSLANTSLIYLFTIYYYTLITFKAKFSILLVSC